ncbi:MAG TPA: hypothetical protein VE932_08030 [Patescibacteria group bacterium]|nr:hypothetical protein [Patescibacteria group bacterium]
MQFLIAVACAVVVVALAMRGVPRRVGVVRAVGGVVTFCSVGYLWILAMWIAVPRLSPVFSALPGVYLKAILALLLYFAPPTLAALAAVRLIAGAARRDRMAG